MCHSYYLHMCHSHTSVGEEVMADQHANEKTALVVGIVAVSITGLWLFH